MGNIISARIANAKPSIINTMERINHLSMYFLRFFWAHLKKRIRGNFAHRPKFTSLR